MVILVFGLTAFVFLIGVLATELILYGFRWYEISNRSNFPETTWRNLLKAEKYKPARVFIKESFWAVIYIFSYIPWLIRSIARKKRAEFEPGELVKGKPLIILIHGIAGKSDHFWLMRRRFSSRSVPNVLTFDYDSDNRSLAENCESLRDFLLRIRAKTGMSEAVLIGHSLGGLIAHEYTRKFGESGEVKAVVALGSPFRGTRLAVMALTSKARSLAPSNPVFADIISSRLNTSFLSVYSRYDQFIIPYTNSDHPGADENREIELCGHTGFFFNKKVFKIIFEWIDGRKENSSGPG
ncbi:MAG TPA: alpha/beta fold hydrolase [Nitrospirae bacterium]|nr:alpha/beta fold hydrolase [Nitrospirota bacterium]